MDKLKETLKLHQKWLNNEPGGMRANLSGANLSEANLRWANLSGANLSGADLRSANLGAANLSAAGLYGADLYGADLRGANLRSANLGEANLCETELREANLQGANLDGACLPLFQITPRGYPMYGFKKLANGTIAVLKIPAGANRTATLVGRKCRAEFATIVAGSGGSKHNSEFLYSEGITVYPDKYDDDIRLECTNGIHFFQTYEEALTY